MVTWKAVGRWLGYNSQGDISGNGAFFVPRDITGRANACKLICHSYRHQAHSRCLRLPWERVTNTVLSSRSQKARLPWKRAPPWLNWIAVKTRFHHLEEEGVSPRHLAMSPVTWRNLPTGLKVSVLSAFAERRQVGLGEVVHVYSYLCLLYSPTFCLFLYLAFLCLKSSSLQTSSCVFLWKQWSEPGSYS